MNDQVDECKTGISNKKIVLIETLSFLILKKVVLIFNLAAGESYSEYSIYSKEELLKYFKIYSEANVYII